jgi:hypothetical protein
MVFQAVMMQSPRNNRILLAISLVHLALLIWSARKYTVGVDETQMVAGGLAVLQFSDFRLYSQTPPATKVLVALPYYLAGGRLDEFKAWRTHGTPWELGLLVMEKLNWDWRECRVIKT